MSRRRRRRERARRARAGAWFLAAGGLLVGGLVVGAHIFDEPAAADPARSLEGAPTEPPATWDRIRVEVLNAGGVQGMAGRARDHLRDAGFDVVFYGNAASFDRDTTVVLARTGSASAARAVAGRLGVEHVEAAPDSTRFVDVTVLLGTDWSAETAPAADTLGGAGAATRPDDEP